jgi:hypothetical protein
MTFTAECPFCRVMLRGVPEQHNGASIECPQCKTPFTLAEPIRPREPRAVQGVSDTAVTTLTAPAGPILFRGHHLRTRVDSSAGALSTGRIDEAGSRVSGFAVASFFLSTMALLCASIPGASIVVLPAAGAGLVCGGISILSRRQRLDCQHPGAGDCRLLARDARFAGAWPPYHASRPDADRLSLRARRDRALRAQGYAVGRRRQRCYSAIRHARPHSRCGGETG